MASLHQRNIKPMQCARRCGARTRAGTHCAAPSIAGAARCRMHGGKGSGAPSGNRNAVKTGLHTARMRAEAKQVRQIVRRATALIELVEGMRSAGLAAATESNQAPMPARRARSTSCPAPQLKVELAVSSTLISGPRKFPTAVAARVDGSGLPVGRGPLFPPSEGGRSWCQYRISRAVLTGGRSPAGSLIRVSG